MPNSTEPRRGALKRLADSFLAIPQPGHQERQQELQDKLLPEFQEDARVSWFLSWPPVHPEDLSCVYDFLRFRMKDPHTKDRIKRLKDLLDEMRVFDLLDAAAVSPDLPALIERTPAHEVRILSQSGHPRAAEEFERLLRRAIIEPTKLSYARNTLDRASNSIAYVPDRITSQKADKKQLSGRGTLYSGLVLLVANGAITPTVMCSEEMSLVLLRSFVGGIAMVDKGIEDLLTS